MKFNAARYVRRHWTGKLSLSISFWINFFLLYIVLALLERFLLLPYLLAPLRLNPLTVSYSVAIFSIVVRLIIYPWQIVGVIRACEKSINSSINRIWVIAAQGVMVISIVATLTLAFSSYQSLLRYQHSLLPQEHFEFAPKYSLDLVEQGTLVHLRGQMQPGITQRTLEFIQQHPAVTGIILDSKGGQIAAGRGLAKIIRENKLDTYSLEACMSACTTAFAAGVHRVLGENAKLGFHQYQSFTVYPHFDIDQEQAKDIALFKKHGISDSFLENIFRQPPENMWLPDNQQLLQANFVHQINFKLSEE